MTSAAPATESVLPIPATTEISSKMLEENQVNAWTGTNTLLFQHQEKDMEIINYHKETDTSTKEPETKTTVEETTTVAPAGYDEIDSALLAALRDPRERLPLLKLEQALVDFLDKQPQDRYIDVGGPYNSIVVSPTLGHIGGMEEAMHSGGGGNAKDGNYVRPQSNFQRCILHRLCDRFRMTREKSYVDEGFGYYIRVVRGPDSRVPPRLLLDVQPSEYALTMHESISSGSLTSSLEQMGISGGATAVAAAADGNSGSALPPTGTPATTATTKSSKPRKMKIMKRSSNGKASANDKDSGKTSKKDTIKRNSSLSEKERKYAEARARIFETEESAEDLFAATPANEPSSDRTSPITDGANRAHSNASSRSSTPSLGGSNSRTPPITGSSGNLDGGNSATNSSKATYRNRQQEEADPDFRRGARMVVTSKPVPGWNGGSASATPYYPTNAGGRGYYGHQQASHQQYQYGMHPQYHQQYFMAAPQGHGHGTANAVVVPGMQTAGYPVQAVHYGQGVPMAMGSGNATKTTKSAATNAAVDLTHREQFPALK